ncbi:hypothetical protein YH64_009335 [Achromobacter sp. LC458]|uniref:hypothetical protein n=1 Tax=Achromobacter sp. LC458 TaxID=1120623 RepID=UPI00062A312B|nr:hypothetical protein [Achromobacter sp. LC458]TRM53291.1 hypothetical protein YH64_009335 [Achromobacter sp. LC458]
MPRTADEIITARRARSQSATKLRKLGYQFAKKSATQDEVISAIHRYTGWPRPERGGIVGYLVRFAALEVGEPAPSRQRDALNARDYRLDRWMRVVAERAAQAQRPLVHAVSRIDNWRLMGGTGA